MKTLSQEQVNDVNGGAYASVLTFAAVGGLVAQAVARDEDTNPTNRGLNALNGALIGGLLGLLVLS